MTPRGILNNNPGNIELSGIDWLGLSDEQNDKPYAQFTSSTYGIRAIARDWKTMQLEGITKLSEAICKWSATDQAAYVANVSAWTGLPADQPTDFSANMLSIIKAVIRQEQGLNNGQPWYTDSLISYAISLA